MIRYPLIPVAAVLILLPTLAAAKPPEVGSAYGHWDAAEAAYAADFPAAVLDHYVEVEITFSHNYEKFYGEQTRRIILAVFDPAEAKGLLEQRFRMEPDTKLKKLEVKISEREPGGSLGERLALDEKLVHQEKLPGGATEVRFPLPNFDDPALVIMDIVTEEKRPGIILADFGGEYPLVHGEFRFSWPGVAKHELKETAELLDKVWYIVPRGAEERAKPYLGDRGLEMKWEFVNVPGWSRNPFVAAKDQSLASIYFVPKWMTWDEWTGLYHAMLQDLRLPAEFKDAAEAAKALPDPMAKVEAVAAFLDDRGQFKLTSGPRNGGLYPGSLKVIARDREGDAFDKTTLAHLLLREAGVKSDLVLAAARNRTALDFRVAYPFVLDAALLRIPALGEGGFIWDVADPSAPLGVAGADLDRRMVVCGGDKAEWFEFPVAADDRVEKRMVTWALSDDGSLEGDLTWEFSSWPADRDVTPWSAASEVTESLHAHLGDACDVVDPTWTPETPGPRPDADHPVVLAASLVDEAEAQGDAGWSLAALPWVYPDPLWDLCLPTWERNVTFPRGLHAQDMVTVQAPGMRPGMVPSPVSVQNAVGGYECTWTASDGLLVVQRRLAIPAQVISGEEFADLEALRKAWGQTRLERAVFEPAE